MEEELKLEEITDIEAIIYVKWYGNVPSLFARPITDTFTPAHDVAYRIRIPKPSSDITNPPLN